MSITPSRIGSGGCCCSPASLSFYATFRVDVRCCSPSPAGASTLAALALAGIAIEPRRGPADDVLGGADSRARRLTTPGRRRSSAPVGVRVKLCRAGLAVAAGLSFYTFSCDQLSRRRVSPAAAGRTALRPLRASTSSFFPKLLAGPIERAKPFLGAATPAGGVQRRGRHVGLQLMLWGLFKKVVIADRLAPFVDAGVPPAGLCVAGRSALSPPTSSRSSSTATFSGYSDIAIGASRVLGFDLMENFRRPYLSTSVREFWARRWHLSLTSWFRDYLYIPLGGNRVSRSARRRT